MAQLKDTDINGTLTVSDEATIETNLNVNDTLTVANSILLGEKEVDTVKSAITVYVGASQTLTTSAAKVVMGNTLSIVGDAFTLDNGGILFNRTARVEVSGSLVFTTSCATGDIIYTQIWKDSTNIATVGATRAFSGVMCDIAIPPVITVFAEGTHLYLYAYNSTTAGGVMAPYTYNRLTVKEV